ncbi:hypothetical protein IT575_12245 [bacterium]|nr:hypothetical protein [bacterium]
MRGGTGGVMAVAFFLAIALVLFFPAAHLPGEVCMPVSVVSRRLEAYTLTISELPAGTSYFSFIEGLLELYPDGSDRAKTKGEKTHVLLKAARHGAKLMLRFGSYKEGYRPDIVDADDLEISTTQLAENETFIAYTHVVLKEQPGGALMAVERNQQGIWPGGIGKYLTWLMDKAAKSNPGHKLYNPRVMIELTELADVSFMQAVNDLDRIRVASVQIPRPNRNWLDLEGQLSETADESDARTVELKMTARRNGTLDKKGGVMSFMNFLSKTGKVFSAKVVGVEDGQKKELSTAKSIKKVQMDITTDDHGVIPEESAYSALGQALEDFEG